MAQSSVMLGAVGDIAFTGQIGQEMQAHGYDWPFAKVQPHLDRAELLFGNFEAAMVPPNFPPEEIDPQGLGRTQKEARRLTVVEKKGLELRVSLLCRR